MAISADAGLKPIACNAWTGPCQSLMQKKMKAALLREFAKPLELEEVPSPVPGPGQVLIRVGACGACHSDVHIWKGEWEGFKSKMPMPLILGHEVAGTVVQAGRDVK